MICDREQCRYEGPPGESAAADSERERRTNAACGTGCLAWFCSFPLVAAVVGGVAAVVIGVPVGWAVILGLVAGVGSVVAVYRWAYRLSPIITRCPACRRGRLLDPDSERGKALLIRRRQRGPNL